MSRQMATAWWLFVDESGVFGDVDDDVDVAGLLVRDDVAASDSASLRAALERAMPGLPWPIHTAYLNVPATTALARWARMDRRGQGSMAAVDPVDGVAASAVDCWRQHGAPELDVALRAFGSGVAPRLAVVRGLDALLRERRRDLHEALALHVRRASALVIDLIDGLARSAPARGEDDCPVATVLSAEACRGDAMVARSGDARRDDTARYRLLLGCLLERVRDVLCRLGGRHHVWLKVLGRDVFEPTVGQAVPLHFRHLRDVLAAITDPCPERVRLVPEVVLRFDERAHAAVVLADFIANRARWRLAHRHWTLSRLEDALRHSVGGCVRSGNPPLSHLAASGWAWGRVQDARLRTQKAPTAPPACVKRWAIEQAEEWAAFLEKRA